LLAHGKLNEALARADAAAQQEAAQQFVPSYVEARMVRVRALLALEQWSEAEAEAAEVLAVALAEGYRPMAWRLQAHRARALVALGRHDAERVCGEARQLVTHLAAEVGKPDLRRSLLLSADVALITCNP
jgi:hypothetical protein